MAGKRGAPHDDTRLGHGQLAQPTGPIWGMWCGQAIRRAREKSGEAVQLLPIGQRPDSGLCAVEVLRLRTEMTQARGEETGTYCTAQNSLESSRLPGFAPSNDRSRPEPATFTPLGLCVG